MARQRQIVNQYAFNKGLVTDASPLAYPENTATKIKNMVPDIEGSLSFRPGLGLEGDGIANNDGYTLTTENATTVPRNAVRWRSAAPGLDLMVAYVAGDLVFFKETTKGMQSQYKVFKVISLAGMESDPENFDYRQHPIQMAPTNGALFITGRAIQPCYVATNDNGGLVDPVAVVVKERDFAGVDEDQIESSERPKSLTEFHRYNLINRGWDEDQLQKFFETLGVYPSLNDLVTLGYYTKPSDGIETWSAAQYDRAGFRLPSGGAVKGSIVKRVTDYGVVSLGTELFDVTVDVMSASLAGTTLTVTVTLLDPHELKVGESITLKTTTDINVTSGDPFGAFTVPYYAVHWWHGTNEDVSNSTATGAPGNPLTDLDTTPLDITVASIVDDFTFTFTATIVKAAADANTGAGVFTCARDAQVPRFTEPFSMTATAFYAGRVWWAGQQSNRIGNRIYFSQVLDTPGKAGRCYAEADPTAREINEVIDTDGGAISINDMGQVQKLIGMNEMLVVFATNGVWAIFGRDGIFTATDYGQRKVGTQGLVSANSVVDIGGSLCCWTTSGIYVMGSDGNTGLTMQNLTDGTLQGFLTRERLANPTFPVLACYDNVRKTVVFQYGSHKYLALDFRLGAFSTYEIDNSEDGILHENYVPLLPYFHEYAEREDERLKFLVAKRMGATNDHDLLWYQFNDETYVDFADSGIGTQVEHEVVTGHIVGADAARSTIPTYVWVFMARIEGTDCTMQSRYNFSTSGDSNKWSMEQRCYRDPPESTDVSRAKLRCRGEGKTFQLRFYSKGKPGKLLGWSMLVEQETDD